MDEKGKDENSMYWESGWTCWLAFNAEYGNVEIPADKPALSRWVKQQRYSYRSFQRGKSSVLDEEKIDRMNSKGFRWEIETDLSPKNEEAIVDEEDMNEAVRDLMEEHEDEAKKKAGTTKDPPGVKCARASDADIDEADENEVEEEEVVDEHQEDMSKTQDLKEGEEEERPVTPEMEKMSEAFVAGDDMLSPLDHHAHFVTAQEDVESEVYEQMDVDDDTESDEEWNLDRKPRPRTRAPKLEEATKMPPPPDTADAKASTRYPRRNRRTLSEGDAYVNYDNDDYDNDEPDAKRLKAEDDSPGKTPVVYSVMKVSEKTGKKELRNYSLRQLRRLVPEHKEDEVREECRVEYADLLICEEPLEPDKKKGVDHQTAKSNIAWENNFLDYLVFRKVYGHGIVPKIFSVNPFLGRWTVRNRRWWKCNDKRLTKSRLRRLNGAKFVWEAKKDPAFWAIQQQTTQEDDKWETRFNMLLEFKEEHGHCLVPKEFVPNMVLARWVGEQRKQMKAKLEGEHSTLNDDREERLRDIGFVFNTRTREHLRNSVLQRFQDRWNTSFERLLKFKEVYGHGAVPRRWKADKDLASWAMRQRSHGKKYMKGEKNYLTKERFELLKSVGFVFEMDRNKYPMTPVRRAADELVAPQGEAVAQEEDEEEAVSMEIVEAKVVEEAVAAAVADSSIQLDLDEKISAVPLVVDSVVPAIETEIHFSDSNTGEQKETIKEQEKLDEKPVDKLSDEPAGQPSNKVKEEPTTPRRSTRYSKAYVTEQPRLKLPTRASRSSARGETASPDEATSSPATRRSTKPTRQSKNTVNAKQSLAAGVRQSQRKTRNAVSDTIIEVDSLRRIRHSKMSAVLNTAGSTATKEYIRDDIQTAKPEAEEVETEEHEAVSETHPKDKKSHGEQDGNEVDPAPNDDDIDRNNTSEENTEEQVESQTKDPVESNGDKQYDDDAANENEEKSDDIEEKMQEDNVIEAKLPEFRPVKNEEGEIEEQGEHETETTMDEPQASVETELTPEEMRQKLLQRNKGVWVCEFSGKDEFFTYVNFLAHEAACAELQGIAIPGHERLE